MGRPQSPPAAPQRVRPWGQPGASARSAADKRTSAISYRLGDTWSPALQEREPLGQVVCELASSIRNRTMPRTSGESGLRVLSVLEAVTQSLSTDGQSTIVAGNEVSLQVAR